MQLRKAPAKPSCMDPAAANNVCNLETKWHRQSLVSDVSLGLYCWSLCGEIGELSLVGARVSCEPGRAK